MRRKPSQEVDKIFEQNFIKGGQQIGSEHMKRSKPLDIMEMYNKGIIIHCFMFITWDNI